MVRKVLKVTLAGMLGMAAVFLSYGGASTAADEPGATTKTIMQKSFNDKTGYAVSINTAAKDAKWDDAKKLAKEWVEFSTSIGKNKPAKGEAKSWETLCGKFCDDTKNVLKAAEAKDAKAVATSVSNKTFGCMDCHNVHREQKKKKN